MSELEGGIVNEQPLNTDVGNSTPQADNTAPVTSTTPVVNEVEIEGLGKVKYDDIKEWNKGNMRQSDYTKKTQEIAQFRKENAQALEVYNYLKNNPQLAQAMQQGDYSGIQGTPIANNLNPFNNKIEGMEMKLAHFELDNNINHLKSKYSDFDEVAVLTEADRLGIADLEFVHNALQGKKLPTLKEKLTSDIRKELTNQIRQNGIDTSTIIGETDATVKETAHGLTQIELRMAENMRLTPEQYAKGKKR